MSDPSSEDARVPIGQSADSPESYDGGCPFHFYRCWVAETETDNVVGENDEDRGILASHDATAIAGDRVLNINDAESTYTVEGPISSRLRSSRAKEVRLPSLKKQSVDMVGKSCGKRLKKPNTSGKGKISIPRAD
jgi:hypothetical protein